MNADLFKPVPERGPHQPSAPAKASRNKPEQAKPEVAQVVTDSKTGRSYSKGKLLGKVRFSFYMRLFLRRSRVEAFDLIWTDGCGIKGGSVSIGRFRLITEAVDDYKPPVFCTRCVN